MNICFFSIVTYWHGVKGGMEIHEKILCEELVKRGHKVIVISTKHPDGNDFEKQDGIELYYLKDTVFGSRRKGWDVASLKKFAELESVNNFDIICSMAAIIPKKLFKARKKIPVIMISEGTDVMMLLSEIKQTLSHGKGFCNLFKTFLSFTYYYCFRELSLNMYDGIIAVSDKVARSTIKWHFINRKKVFIVYNGVETHLFHKDLKQRRQIRDSLAISDKEKIILFFSFVTRQKGAHLLIKALPDILKKEKNIRLLIAGEGNYLNEAKQLTRQSDMKKFVIFTGHIPRKVAPHYINASDVFVLPTLRQEGMPFSLLEAMACKKAVIASNIGGIPSAIDDGINGLLIPPDNISKLIEKILLLLNNKELADTLSENARTKVIQNFSHEKMVDNTIKVFESIKKQRSL